MAFVYPQPRTDELARVHKSRYLAATLTLIEEPINFEQRRKGIEAGTLTGASLLENLDLMGLRVVEISAADGALLAWCKSRGAADAFGIEFSDEAAAGGPLGQRMARRPPETSQLARDAINNLGFCRCSIRSIAITR